LLHGCPIVCQWIALRFVRTEAIVTAVPVPACLKLEAKKNWYCVHAVGAKKVTA
jgi:hypothetical protein